ncbi:MAG: class I SAM-dependent methyltransferase [Candidatus Dormibacteria bacterium]
MSIHPQAKAGFARGAAAYERGRPTYPPAAVGWLAGRLGLGAGRVVLDLGAGTGKLTRQLVPFGARVIALEPVAEMAEQLERAVPGVEVLAATAASTSLSSGHVDAATAGQAFHWFSDPDSLKEIHRVLRPRGWLGLIWNVRDVRSPLWRAINELVEPLREGTPDHVDRAWRQRLEQSLLFSPLESRAFEHHQLGGPEQLVDRIFSLSYVAALAAEAQERLGQQILRLADEYRGLPGQPLVLPYRCEVFACRSC